MTQPVIDTLRLADRLKESGFQDTQAEGLARALGGAYADHIATKVDLDSGIRLVRTDYRVLDERIDVLDEKFEARFSVLDERIDALDEKFEARFSAFDARIDALDEKFEARFSAFDARIDALDEKFEARFSAFDARIDALDEKFEARFDSLGRQITFMFAALAALLALGLIDTAQRLLG